MLNQVVLTNIQVLFTEYYSGEYKVARSDNESVLLTKTLPNGGTIITEDPSKVIPPSAEIIKKEKQEEGRNWRDKELRESDWIVPTTDHPQHVQYIRYRKVLRDWPSTTDFPDKKPVLGS